MSDNELSRDGHRPTDRIIAAYGETSVSAINAGLRNFPERHEKNKANKQWRGGQNIASPFLS